MVAAGSPGHEAVLAIASRAPASLASTRGRGLQTSEHRVALLVGDAVVASFGVLFGLWVWTITAGETLSTSFVAERVYWLLGIPAWLVALIPAYDLRVALSIERTLLAVVRAAAMLFVLYLAVYFYAPREELPRLMALYWVWEAALLTLGWRLVYIWLFTETGLRRRILVFGAGDAGRDAVRLLREHGTRHAEVVGFLDDDASKSDASVDGIKVLGGHDDLARIVGERHVSEVVLAVTHHMHDTALRTLIQAQEQGIELVRLASLYEDLAKRVPVAHLEPDWLITSFVDAVRANDSSRLAKRAFDIVGSFVVLAGVVLVWPFIALAIWLETGRPILYRQTRVGRGGSTFSLCKFRTMVHNAEETTGPQFAVRDDPRVTRVGRVLRRTRLDELPQAWNVLKGEMSLVGPRPERPEFVASLETRIPFYRTRLIARPGVTGWAQVNLSALESSDDPVAKLEYDLYYIQHRTLLFDLRIMLRTLRTILRLEGN